MTRYTGERGGYDALGFVMNSQGHRINAALAASPQTAEAIAARAGVARLTRVKEHLRTLCARGYAFRGEGGWALTERGALLMCLAHAAPR